MWGRDRGRQGQEEEAAPTEFTHTGPSPGLACPWLLVDTPGLRSGSGGPRPVLSKRGVTGVAVQVRRSSVGQLEPAPLLLYDLRRVTLPAWVSELFLCKTRQLEHMNSKASFRSNIPRFGQWTDTEGRRGKDSGALSQTSRLHAPSPLWPPRNVTSSSLSTLGLLAVRFRLLLRLMLAVASDLERW